MRAVRADPGSRPEVIDVPKTKEAFEAVVGGSLDQLGTVSQPSGRKIVFYINKDGRALGLRPNREIAKVPVVGPILAVAVEGDTKVAMTDGEVKAAVRALRDYDAEVQRLKDVVARIVMAGLLGFAAWAIIAGVVDKIRRPPDPPEVIERRQRQEAEEEAEEQARELERKQLEIRRKQREWEQECADQGLVFVGTVDGKVECRKH